jgi:type I restriction enzyme S subunit
MAWRTQPIEAVCEPTDQRDPSAEPSSEFRYVDIAGIDRVHKTIAEFQVLLGAEAPSRARKLIRRDDVLVSTVRPNLNAVAVVPEELDGEVASTGFCVLRANRAVIEPRYLFYRTICADFVSALAAKVRGANYPAVSDSDVKSVEISLPPLSEQRRIVEILDQADNLRRLRTEADTKADRILPALFLEMFGDPNLPAIATVALPDVVDCLDHRRVPVREANRANRSGKIPYYGANGLVGYIDEPIFDATLVLLAEDGGYWGPAERSAYKIEGPSWVNNHAHVLRCREGVDPDFIVWSLILLDLRRYVSGTTRGKLTQAGMNKIGLPRADRRRQAGFGRCARAQAKLVTEQRRARAKLQITFAGLLHQAFSGSLTATWREAHMNELLSEMEQQAKFLAEA